MAQTIFCDVAGCATPADLLVQILAIGQVDAFCSAHYEAAIIGMAAHLIAEAEAEAASGAADAASLQAAEDGLDGAGEDEPQESSDDTTTQADAPEPTRARRSEKTEAVAR